MAHSTPIPGRRLLILKFGAIGDVVMTIPGARLMHEDGYAVDWVCGRAAAPVLALYPWIHVIAVDDRPLLRGSGGERARGLLALWRMLRGRVGQHGDYDTVATLYYDRRYRLLSWPLRARRKLLLSHIDRRFALLPGRHHADEFARILTGREDAETPTQLAPIPAPGLPAAPLPGVRDGRRRVVLVSGGARNMLRDDALRRWPIWQYVTLATTLLERGDEVVLAGGPDDRWTLEHFATLLSRFPEQMIDRTGHLSLVETLALLDSADATVTHDTGPLHLAGITRTAIVTIFGPVDPHGRLPHRPNCVALWGGEGFACRPCYDGTGYAPCPHNGCMEQITPAMVLAALDQTLEARSVGRDMPPRVLSPSQLSPFAILAGSAAR